MTEPLNQIGRVRKAHGLKGELKVEISAEYLEDFVQATVLYLGDDRQQIPYFVENFRSLPQPIVKLEEVDTREQAEQLSQPYIYIPTAELVHEPASYDIEPFEYAYLKHISVVNPAGEILGVIDRLEQFPQQEMGVLLRDGREILIPLNDTFLLSVDLDKAQAVMEFPEGLLEL